MWLGLSSAQGSACPEMLAIKPEQDPARILRPPMKIIVDLYVCKCVHIEPPKVHSRLLSGVLTMRHNTTLGEFDYCNSTYLDS